MTRARGLHVGGSAITIGVKSALAVRHSCSDAPVAIGSALSRLRTSSSTADAAPRCAGDAQPLLAGRRTGPDPLCAALSLTQPTTSASAQRLLDPASICPRERRIWWRSPKATFSKTEQAETARLLSEPMPHRAFASVKRVARIQAALPLRPAALRRLPPGRVHRVDTGLKTPYSRGLPHAGLAR